MSSITTLCVPSRAMTQTAPSCSIRRTASQDDQLSHAGTIASAARTAAGQPVLLRAPVDGEQRVQVRVGVRATARPAQTSPASAAQSASQAVPGSPARPPWCAGTADPALPGLPVGAPSRRSATSRSRSVRLASRKRQRSWARSAARRRKARASALSVSSWTACPAGRAAAALVVPGAEHEQADSPISSFIHALPTHCPPSSSGVPSSAPGPRFSARPPSRPPPPSPSSPPATSRRAAAGPPAPAPDRPRHR